MKSSFGFKHVSGKMGTWRRRLCIIIPLAAIVGLSIAWYSLQPSLTFAFEKASVKETHPMTLDGKPFDMPYRLFVPEEAPPEQGYPVLLYLCGSAQCGKDNNIQAVFDVGYVDRLVRSEDASKRCIIIAPQIPRKSLSTDDEILAGYMDIVKTVQEKYNADKNRLYMIGFSMGGDSIWKLLEKYPDEIAAAVPICGGLFDTTQAYRYKDVPVWVFQGSLDTLYPISKTRGLVDKLMDMGDRDVKFTEYKFTLHVCWQKAYAEPELPVWMFAQSRR